MKCKLVDIAEFNPKESLKKGTVAKKVAMEQLRPFCRDIPGYTLEAFNGGTKFRNGDTIMARITPCLENGKTAKVTILDNGEIGFGSTEYIVFRAKEGVSDEDYLYYLICSPLVRDAAIKSMVGSSGRQRVQTDVVQNIEIDLPPIAAQKRIGSLLRSLDDKIELNNKINENLEQQAALLVERYIRSTGNTVPLSEIMCFDNGFAFQSKNYLPSGKYRIITIKNVQDGFIDSTGAAFIDSIPQNMKACCFLHTGDVLLSLTGNVGRVGIVCEKNLLLNQRVAKFMPFESDLLPFLYFFFRQSIMKSKLEMIAKGTAQLNLSPIETLRQEIPYEKETAKACSQALNPLYRAIISNNQQNLTLKKLRDNLLPRLLSGNFDFTRIYV